MGWNRRQLIKVTGCLSLITLIKGGRGLDLAFGSNANEVPPLDYKLAKTSDQIPQNMQYAEDAKKTGGTTRKDKQAFCHNCTQYGKTHVEFEHPKDGRVATCEIFPNGNSKLFVKRGGWCVGYSKDSNSVRKRK